MSISDKYSETLKIAIPAVMESLFTVIVSTIDTKMISVLGDEAISAVSLTNQPKIFFYAVFVALGTALSIFVAQAYGRKDKEEANTFFHAIIMITAITAVLLGTLLAVFARPVMTLLSRQSETIELSVIFFRILMGFVFFQAMVTILNAALRAIGKTKLTLISNVCMGVTDIIFNYLLIEGHLGFPRLEVAGDALATVMGAVVACIVSGVIIATQSDFLSFKGLFAFKLFSQKEVRKAIREKAGNTVIENLAMKAGFLIASVIVSTMKSEQTAVYFVVMILMNYSFAFGDGLQNAVAALTGRSAGAGSFKEVKEYLHVGVVLSLICSTGLGTIYILGAERYIKMFFSDPAQISMGVIFVKIVAFISLFQVVRIVYAAATRSVGEVKKPRQISVICVLILNPLLSLVFAQFMNMQIWGIWLASLITQIVWGAASLIVCRKVFSNDAVYK